MRECNFVVPGKPMGKQRPRVLKSGISYTPEKTVNYETFVREMYAIHGKGMMQGPILLEIAAYLPIPQSTSKKNKKLMEDGEIQPTKKPDIDNIIKIIMDALNGVAYADDKEVIGVSAGKQYSSEPRVEITVMECE